MGIKQNIAWLLNKQKRAAAVSSPTNVIESYTWDVSFWPSDISGTSWPEHGGDTTWDLTRTTGSAPTTGVSTSGITSSALPAALVDAAVTPALNGGFHTGTNVAAWGALDNWHCRMLVFDRTTTTLDFFWQWLLGGTNFATIRGNSTTSWRVESRNTLSYLLNPTPLSATATDWYLMDWYGDVNAGGSGNTLSTVWINGTEFTFSEHSASEIPSGSGTFGLMSDRTGNNEADADFLFMGFRWDRGPFTAAQHNADAASLGLDGGP